MTELSRTYHTRAPASASAGAEPIAAPNTDDATTDAQRRVALVGCGFIGAFHAQIMRTIPGVELAAVCDAIPSRAQAFARAHGIRAAVSSVAELVRERIEVAHLLVPPNLHGRMARELLEAGIGVLVEKPLMLDSAEACALDELARARGLPFGVNHNALFHPSFSALLARVRAGEIGRVEHVQVTHSVPLRQLDASDFAHWMFQNPRNIIFEQGLHPFTQISELVGGVQKGQAVRLAASWS
jgi:predicted dehydrogenase